MLSSINFQGNYNIDPSKASPLCKVVAAVDISKFAKEFDGEMTFNPEAHDAFDAVQQPYTLAMIKFQKKSLMRFLMSLMLSM